MSRERSHPCNRTVHVVHWLSISSTRVLLFPSGFLELSLSQLVILEPRTTHRMSVVVVGNAVDMSGSNDAKKRSYENPIVTGVTVAPPPLPPPPPAPVMPVPHGRPAPVPLPAGPPLPPVLPPPNTPPPPLEHAANMALASWSGQRRIS